MCVFLYACPPVLQNIVCDEPRALAQTLTAWFCFLIGACESARGRKARISVCLAVQICQLCGLVLAVKGKDPLPLTPICPVRVSHKVQTLLIVPVPDGRFMEDESDD